ncbi:protein LNK4 [Raphanus sativus]|uniref:Protein LNK4 n=1 Tax=Raphanus sativus TaxID=3726 RepID=A0A6J0KAP8_RAPSA|nr:protein LNK4 [Raphanus sativus]
MDRYSRRNAEDLVVPNYHETSDSYPSSDMWGGWSMNSQKAAEKCFDFDVINNGFSGGLYSQMDMEIGTSGEEVKQEEEEESKRLKTLGCFYNSASSLHDFDGIQQMDDVFLSSILEDVPGNGNLHCFKESDNNSPGSSSVAYLDTLDGREVPMYQYNWEACNDMPLMEGEEAMKISDLCEENMGEPSTEEVVLQDLQRASEKLNDVTRKCFRDTFYRLAKNSQLKCESDNINSEAFLEDRTFSGNINQKTESETNSIDRAVANLTFNNMESNMRNLPPPKRVSCNQG